MGILTSGLALAASAAKSIEIIPEGEIAVLRRAGSYTRRYDSQIHKYIPGDFYRPEAGDFLGHRGKGVALSWPFAERYVRFSKLPNTDTLPNQILTSKEKLQMMVGSSIIWHVIGEGVAPYKALYAVDSTRGEDIIPELRQRVIPTCAQAVAKVMNGMSSDAMYEFAKLDERIKDECEKPLSNIGVNLIQVQFESPYETPAEVNRQATFELADAIRTANQNQSLGAMAAASAMRESPVEVLPIPRQSSQAEYGAA